MYSGHESGLDRDSTVLLEQLFTLDQRRLGTQRGRLPAVRIVEVDAALKKSLALP